MNKKVPNAVAYGVIATIAILVGIFGNSRAFASTGKWLDAKCDVEYGTPTSTTYGCGVVDIKSVSVDYTSSKLAVTMWFYSLSKNHDDFIVSFDDADKNAGANLLFESGADFGPTIMAHDSTMPCHLRVTRSFTDREVVMSASTKCLHNTGLLLGKNGDRVRIKAEALALKGNASLWDGLGKYGWSGFISD